MKTLSLPLLLCTLAALAFAAEAAKKETSPSATEAKAAEIPATQAKITSPMVLHEGAISQAERTELEGGKAVFEFTVPKDGDYVIHAMVNAADDDSNSFFLNVDAPPEELMIWDVDEFTKGFEERVVNWRGTGVSGSAEFSPKVFKLTAGAHKLHLVGREPTLLKSISVRPAPPAEKK
jgi:hypothetical protein